MTKYLTIGNVRIRLDEDDTHQWYLEKYVQFGISSNTVVICKACGAICKLDIVFRISKTPPIDARIRYSEDLNYRDVARHVNSNCAKHLISTVMEL